MSSWNSTNREKRHSTRFSISTLKVVSRTTGINEVKQQAGDNRRFYDLRGQEVNQPKNGIYIEQKDGKADKLVVK